MRTPQGTETACCFTLGRKQMLLLIKNSISSLSPSINRGCLSVGSRRVCVRLWENGAGGCYGKLPPQFTQRLSCDTTVTPPPCGFTYASVTDTLMVLADLGVPPQSWRTRH